MRGIIVATATRRTFCLVFVQSSSPCSLFCMGVCREDLSVNWIDGGPRKQTSTHRNYDVEVCSTRCRHTQPTAAQEYCSNSIYSTVSQAPGGNFMYRQDKIIHAADCPPTRAGAA